MAARLTEDIFAALGEQTVTVTGTNAAEKIIARLDQQLAQLGQERTDIEAEILAVVDARPLTQVLTFMPGVGVRTAARILTEVVVRTSRTPPTWPHTLASPRSLDAPGPQSVGSRPNGAATRPSNGPGSSPRSPRSTPALLQGRTTTGNEPRASATTKPSSLLPDAAPTSPMRCSMTVHSTASPSHLRPPWRHDENYRSTSQSLMIRGSVVTGAGPDSPRPLREARPTHLAGAS